MMPGFESAGWVLVAAAVFVGTVLGAGMALDAVRKRSASGLSAALIVLSGTTLAVWGPVVAVAVVVRVSGRWARRRLLRSLVAAMQEDPDLRRQVRDAISTP